MTAVDAAAGSAPTVVVNDATVGTSAINVNPSVAGSVDTAHLRSIEPHTRYTRCETSIATSDVQSRPGVGSCTNTALLASATTEVDLSFMAERYVVIT